MASFHSGYITALLVVLVLVVWKVWNENIANTKRLPLPPGPRRLPFIGNILNYPKARRWLAFDAMAQKYGDIFYLNVLGQPVVILNSLQAATDLLEKRSSIYSDRPHLPMALDLTGFDWIFVLFGYTDRWRKHRRVFHQHFNENTVDKYSDVIMKSTHELLRRLLRQPEDFLVQTKYVFAAMILKIAYGIDVKEKNDDYIHIVNVAMTAFSVTVAPGAFFVDFFPALKYLPSWLPGMGFKRKAAYWRPFVRDMINQPFDTVKESVKAGAAIPSLAAALIESLPEGANRAEEEEIARNCAGIAYAAGADTTVSYVQSFYLAMVMYPDVQKKAQAELDAVVGTNKLPDFKDDHSLPYLAALTKEVLRWRPVTPLAAPHYTTTNDEYRGYRIPKGTMVIGNAWAILHDALEYPEPEEFRPERWLTQDGQLNPNVRDPTVACFGYGRRICPGRYMAIQSLFIFVASILHSFDISPPLDEDGKPIPVRSEMMDGNMSFPSPYKCSITPRSAAAKALILDLTATD